MIATVICKHLLVSNHNKTKQRENGAHNPAWYSIFLLIITPKLMTTEVAKLMYLHMSIVMKQLSKLWSQQLTPDHTLVIENRSCGYNKPSIYRLLLVLTYGSVFREITVWLMCVLIITWPYFIPCYRDILSHAILKSNALQFTTTTLLRS